ncbi:MAG: bifunctional metallophosphatase/5'-nucleotidase, partial [Bdellovibrionales bacterium]|nr:bifunctional metallophosphatase/5'-nucleotidase [Oligoflexia bacterium]
MARNLILVLSILLVSCAHSISVKPLAPSVPEQAFQSTDPEQETVAVVAINDFHGTLLPKERKLPNGAVVKSGGAEALAAMVAILKQELPGRVLIVDAGDEWQGTLESNLSQGETVVQFYTRLGVNVAAIGNHEFDFGLPNMLKQFSKANYPYVASNIFEKRTGKRPKWRNVFPSRLLKVGGYQFGVIGVSTIQTTSTTRYETVSHLDFKNALVPVTEEAKALRAKGANLVLITAHAGTTCEDKMGLKSWNIWSESTPNSACDTDDEIYRLAQSLKPGSVDGIVSGHTHQVIHHFFNHLPVVQDESYNQFFNIIYYTFNKKTKNLIPSLTRIEGLIPICSQFLEGYAHCDVRKLPAGVSPNLVQASFHGQDIISDPAISAWLRPIEA